MKAVVEVMLKSIRDYNRVTITTVTYKAISKYRYNSVPDDDGERGRENRKDAVHELKLNAYVISRQRRKVEKRNSIVFVVVVHNNYLVCHVCMHESAGVTLTYIG